MEKNMIKTQQTSIRKNHIGKFGWKFGSLRDEQRDLYVFDAQNFPQMRDILERLTSAQANLQRALARFFGCECHNPFILCYGNTDFNSPVTNPDHSAYHHSTHFVYHIKDCTVQHFLGDNNGFSYLIITNRDYQKRNEALSLLEEVFK